MTAQVPFFDVFFPKKARTLMSLSRQKCKQKHCMKKVYTVIF